jgi:phenylalanine-4-hydroxylase
MDPVTGDTVFDFFLDFDGQREDENVNKLLAALKPLTNKILILDDKQVHWFPRHINELDLIANRTLDAGVDLESDHPGFNDAVYRERRGNLAKMAQEHTCTRPIPFINYTPEETATWSAVWDQMEPLWEKYACEEYKHSLELMKEHCGYGREKIPQQQDISAFLKERTNFLMRPVAGLLSSRDFLNGLAFRVFFSTQYIRHHSMPLYTPEPDICHELLGHAPMFADQSFADFSQEIGLASLGASDDDVDKLAHCYWHSVEFGLCMEDGKHKAYGAGLLSSFGELEYACSDDHPGAENPPEFKPWDPEVAAHQEFPITTYQPVYFVAESVQDAKGKMRKYCEDLQRPFFALHNSQTNTVHIDRPVRRTRGIPDRIEGKTE